MLSREELLKLKEDNYELFLQTINAYKQEPAPFETMSKKQISANINGEKLKNLKDLHKNISEKLKGRKKDEVSEETRKKLREKRLQQETPTKIGTKMSEKTKQKISASKPPYVIYGLTFYTAKEISELLGVCPVYLSNWKSGKRKCPYDIIFL